MKSLFIQLSYDVEISISKNVHLSFDASVLWSRVPYDTQTTARLDKRSPCHTISLLLMDDDCNHGKDDYSDIQDRALGVQCVL